MWELKESTLKYQTKRCSLYLTRKKLSKKVMNSGNQTKRALEKMAIALKEKDNNYSLFLVTGAYKTKNKKV
jgi:hypothetical protein